MKLFIVDPGTLVTVVVDKPGQPLRLYHNYATTRENVFEVEQIVQDMIHGRVDCDRPLPAHDVIFEIVESSDGMVYAFRQGDYILIARIDQVRVL